MPERKMDWLKQARRDLLHAKMDLKEGFYEWACFSAQQAAEKALKAVYQSSNIIFRQGTQMGLPLALRWITLQQKKPGRRSAMQSRSSGSVRVFSLDGDRIRKGLQSAARRLRQADENVLEVSLCGSLAKGRAVPGSDADILIILKSSSKPPLERITDFQDFFSGLGIGVDIFPYTKEELENQKNNLFLQEILKDRVRLA